MAKIRTNDGRLVDPMNIQPEDVIPRVIIAALCKLNRFTGHTDWPYNVGQHTLNLYYYVRMHHPLRPNWAKAVLIHDWQEAWFNDLASPLKKEMLKYKRAEHRAGIVVREVMGVSEDDMDAIDFFDKAIYINERNALFHCYRDDVQGMGDDRIGLVDADKYCNFNEVNWRETFNALVRAVKEEFPQWRSQ